MLLLKNTEPSFHNILICNTDLCKDLIAVKIPKIISACKHIHFINFLLQKPL